MELSDSTLQVLRNFSGINGNILVEEGNVIRTVAESRTVFAKASLDQSFPRSFGIYDLREFLNVLGLVDSPILGFEEHHMRLSDQTGRSNINYWYADESILTTAKSKDLPPLTEDAWFTLTQSDFAKIKQAGAVLDLPDVVATIDSGVMKLTVCDAQSSNTFSIAVDGASNFPDMNLIFKIDNLRMIDDGNYRVTVSNKRISHFENTESNIEYWVALQKESKF